MDRVLLNAMAASQCALLTRAQLLAAGVTDDYIEWRIVSKRWTRIHPGVYLTSPGRSDWMMTATAAVLDAGTGAVLSHRSAGHTFGLVRDPPAVIELLIPHHRTVTARPGVVVRRSRHLALRTDDWLGVPRTSIDHTVLDIASLGDADAAISVAAQACRTGLTWDEGLLRALSQRPGQRWGSLLREALSDIGRGAESVLEVRYIRDVERAHGLPTGVSQLPSAGGRRRHDRGYPEQRLLVELDGAEFHAGAAAVQRDGRRRREGVSEGWTTVPGFWSDVATAPCAFAVEVGGMLRDRGWAGKPKPCRRPACVVRRGR